ncbi:hypothetical protein EHS25_009374 [Saitozyma podzolica]|uniref:Uncharacterized protein n=1 Tax=Saitozyma podzolica TaxID=1890683 RepID=A0A427YLP3_9TREE|nr:hypothetical protein EHS25_009374 [Saitozyma podzolica]
MPYPSTESGPFPSILTITSSALRLASYLAFNLPHTPLGQVVSQLVPLLYLVALPGWIMRIAFNLKRLVVVKDEVVEPEDTKDYPVKRRKAERTVAQETARLPPPRLARILAGAPTSNRLTNVFTLLFNTLLLLFVLDSRWSRSLFLSEDDLTYASLTPHSSSISLRLPPGSAHFATATEVSEITRVAYRPLLAPELRAEESPLSWELSHPVTLSALDDWSAKVTVEGLHPGMQYEYRLKTEHGFFPPNEALSLNFTTFPDSRLARSTGSHFRFVHAAKPRYHLYSYSPLEPFPPLFPVHSPFTTPSPSHIQHRWRAYHLRQPAWRSLADWLEDLRGRVAWAQVKFALVDDELELAGAKSKPLSTASDQHKLRSRQLLASQDVQDVIEAIPILPATLHSEGSHVEPGALADPDVNFNVFYRLRPPFVSRGEGDSQDWQADVADLTRWLRSVNGTSGFKFVLSTMTLAPWFGGSETEVAWREAVLDALSNSANIIVLAESSHGFVTSMLRRTIVEVASPPLDSPTTPRWWPGKSRLVPDVGKARTEPQYRWVKIDDQLTEEWETETVDRLLNFIPNTGGAKWTSVEVDTSRGKQRAVVSAYEKGQPIWSIEVVGVRASRAANAVGSVAESLTGILKKLGLLGGRWF